MDGDGEKSRLDCILLLTSADLRITLFIVTAQDVRMKAQLLKAARAGADVEEFKLKEAICQLLAHGEAVGFAKTLGVTPQYLSDIRKGKRRISDEVLEQLTQLRSKP
jgi:hypothetical protein